MSDHYDCFKTVVLQPRVISFDIVGSTNTEAKQLLMQGESEGLIVTARAQTAGRGRKGRSWISPRGGLYFSLLLKHRFKAENAPLVSLLCACAVTGGIRALGVEEARVKWPNDVLVGRKKVAGILSEATSISDELVGIVVGIGVNQNCQVADFPQDLQSLTTSIIDEIGEETSSMDLLCSIVNEIDTLLQTVETERSFNFVLQEWRKLSATLGERVRIHEEGGTTEGVAVDIAQDGSLMVETEEGLVKVVQGDVSHIWSKD